MTIEKKHLIIELCRRDFWTFCKYYDLPFFSDRPFLKKIADAFQEIEEGKIKTLSISMPPRAGKSYITSLFCAWVIGRNPTESIMRNCCTETLYQKFSYDVRDIVKGQKWKSVFNSRLSIDKQNVTAWNMNEAKQVTYFGSGVGGTIIGFGASKLAITDDLYKSIEDALSDTVNEKVHSWKSGTHDSRVEKGCSMIDIGTRWTMNDVIGHGISNKRYDKIITVPALDENGQSFCENVLSTEEYVRRKSKLAPEIWAAEYMQEPIDIKGRLFGELYFMENAEFDTFYKGLKLEEIESRLAYIDVADSGSDYLAAVTALKIRGEWFIVDYVYTRANTDISMPLVAQMLNKWGVTFCRVESNSMGAMFARGLQRLVKTRILTVHNTVNKETRILMNSVFIIDEFTFVKRPSQDFSLFIQNVDSYSKEGKNKHDDAPDCLAGLTLFIKSLFKIL